MSLRNHRALAPALPLLAVLASCAHATSVPGAGYEEGEASFYGESLEGRRTASGVPFDPRAYTCAHRRLPFGTRLRVLDLETGRKTEVVVTDRGPFVRGRIIDLSLAAARQLGMVKRGRARVRIEVLQ